MSASSKDLAVDESMTNGRLFQDAFLPPKREDIFRQTKLVHGTLYSEPKSSTHCYSYALQSKYDGKDKGNKKPVVVLTAEKAKKPKSPFIIKDYGTNEVVGSVVLQFKTMKYISYSIFRGDLQVASIVYHVPGIMTFLKHDPPRAAQMVLPEPSEKNPAWLAELCKDSILQSGSLNEACNQSPGLILVRNAVPYKKKNGNYALNFKGRGNMQSCRNMQLLDANKEVVCQVAKWEKNVYNVDFAYPYSSFLAFAFALAQLNI